MISDFGFQILAPSGFFKTITAGEARVSCGGLGVGRVYLERPIYFLVKLKKQDYKPLDAIHCLVNTIDSTRNSHPQKYSKLHQNILRATFHYFPNPLTSTSSPPFAP